jgi:hypoxanthine phosphoribosyltransferase
VNQETLASPDLSQSELREILNQSRILVTAEEIAAAIRHLAEVLDKRFDGQVPVVICIMNGGMMLTAQLMSRVKIHACLDYLQTSRYRGNTRGGELTWRIKPSQPLSGKAVVLIDDIFDEGYTLAAITEYCNSQGASEVYSVVLLDKQHDRKIKGFKPDLVGLEIEDEYVVGFGMDYKNHFRHLPAIYSIEDAIKEPT